MTLGEPGQGERTAAGSHRGAFSAASIRWTMRLVGLALVVILARLLLGNPIDLFALLTDLSDRLYLALNALSGRSLLLDTLIALPLENALVKGGPVGACFFYAWAAGGSYESKRRRRSILLLTLVAAFLTIVTTKTVGDNTFLPRPFVRSLPSWHLAEVELEATKTLTYRAPLTGSMANRFEALKHGEVDDTDLVSFPSDHAAFFAVLSLGILIASLPAGLIAALWTLVAIMATRVITGLHSPLDIALGLLIGAAILALVQLIGRRFAGGITVWAAQWTMRREAIAASLAFLVIFEAASALEGIKALLQAASELSAAAAA